MKRIATCLFVLFLAAGATAQHGLQLALLPDLALVGNDEQIKGVSLGIWGENEVDGLGLGFVNGLNRESSGFNFALIGTYGESYTGVMWSLLFNYTKDDFVGWQASCINLSNGHFVGFQSGLVNISQQFKGFQLGLLNYASGLDGLQVGVVNIAADNGWFTEMPGNLAVAFPFVNWSF